MPRIIFTYATPFDQYQRTIFAEKNLGYYPTVEEIAKKIHEWETIWESLNKNGKIFSLFQTLTDIHTTRDFELYIFGRGMNAMSAPFMMPVMSRNGDMFTKDRFIETVTHELAHRVVSDPRNNPGISAYWAFVDQQYASEKQSTKKHILVYALLEKILPELVGAEKYLDFLSPKKPEYQRSLAITRERGADEVIKEFLTHVITTYPQPQGD